MSSETNGTPPEKTPSARRQLRETRAELELVKTRMQLHWLQQQERLLGLGPRQANKAIPEAATTNDLAAGWGSLVDPRDAFPDTDLRTPYGFTSLPSDRAHGRNRPYFHHIHELAIFRQQSRNLVESNSYVEGLQENLCNYYVGTGFKFVAAAKKHTRDADPERPGKQVPDDVQETVDLTQQVIDQFCERNEFSWLQWEAVWRVHEDGEWFWRYFVQPDKTLLVRWIEPEQVQGEPQGETLQDGWSLGIKHQMRPFEDVQTRLAYHVVSMDATIQQEQNPHYTGTGEVVPADEVLHVRRLGTKSTVKRGMPAYKYDTYKAFSRAAKLQDNLSSGAQLQAAIAWIEQFENATKGQIEEYMNGQRDFLRTDPLTQEQLSVDRFRPGTIPRIGKGKEYKEPPSNPGAAAQQAIVQGDLRQGGTAFQAPEFLISGDASNANFASTKEAAAPFIRSGVTKQEYYGSKFKEAVLKAITLAIEGGLLPSNTLQLVDIQVEAPEVIHRDRSELIQENVQLVQARLRSPQSAQIKLGDDPEEQAANWAEWDEANGGDMGGLQDMFGGLPGEEGGEETGEEGGDMGGMLPDGSMSFTEARQRQIPKEILVLMEASKTGIFRDKRGRRYALKDGKRVPLGKAEELGIKDTGGEEQSSGQKQAEKQPSKREQTKAAKEKAFSIVQAAIKTPENLSAQQLAELPKHLDQLTVAQLKQAVKLLGGKPGALRKAELVKKAAADIAQQQAEEEFDLDAPEPEMEPEFQLDEPEPEVDPEFQLDDEGEELDPEFNLDEPDYSDPSIFDDWYDGADGPEEPEPEPAKPEPKKTEEKPKEEVHPIVAKMEGMRSDFGEWLSNVSFDEQLALGNYQSSQHEDINHLLLHPSGVDENGKVIISKFTHRPLIEKEPLIMSRVQDIDAAISKATLTKDLSVMRGVKPGRNTLYKKFQAGELKPGDVVTEASYISTTINPTVSSSWASQDGILLHLDLKKGQKAAPLYLATGYSPVEGEFLLPRGSSYRVKSIEKDDRGRPVIRAEVVDTQAKK